jgi:hypothetical protein
MHCLVHIILSVTYFTGTIVQSNSVNIRGLNETCGYLNPAISSINTSKNCPEDEQFQKISLDREGYHETLFKAC